MSAQFAILDLLGATGAAQALPFPSAWQLWGSMISDLLIGLSCVTISATLAWWVVHARRFIHFHRVCWAFAGFIVGCGMTHFGYVMLALDTPGAGWFLAGAQLLTVVAAVTTALLLIAVAPKAVAVVAAAALSERRRAALVARDEFLSIAAHELKTPITSVRGNAELVLRRLDRGVADPERLRRNLQAIERESDRLARLVGQLLDVSRIEGGQLALERAPTDLAALVREVVARLQGASDRRIRLTVPDEATGAVDGLRIEQVLTNLLTNAITYSQAENPIDVTLELDPDGRVATLRVRDRGPGVPPERRERLFERFYRAGGQDHAAGFGLGLYISRQIVALHRGTLGADFPEDGGTCMMVTLPLDAADSMIAGAWAEGDASLTGPSWSLTTTRLSAN